MGKIVAVLCLMSPVLSASAEFRVDRSVMSDKYWEIWNGTWAAIPTL